MAVVQQRTAALEGAQTWTHDRVIATRGGLYRIYARDDGSYSGQGSAQLTRLSDGVVLFTLDGHAVRRAVDRSHYGSDGGDSDFDALADEFAPVIEADVRARSRRRA